MPKSKVAVLQNRDFCNVLTSFVECLDGVEKAINLLTDTQRACEEIYIDTDETKED